jgi:Flp pilus assembly pilin Flp
MLDLYTWVMTRARREDGQTMAEYAVILGVITLVVVAGLGVLSGAIDTAVRAIADIVGGTGA